MSKYIYARTSTTDQNVTQQIDSLLQKHVVDDVFSDKQSGKDLDRPEFISMKKTVKGGDSIIVQDLSRIGRNTMEVINFVEEMAERRVGIIIDDLGSIDVTSSTGKMVLTVLASVATMRREQMLEKQLIGIARAQQEGLYKGKQASPQTLLKCQRVDEFISSKALTIAQACKLSNVSRATYYRYKKS
ncbi:recombinase family protein [Psychromonas sp. KJ10-10]|uniref:recombinase family protein n=1 Tax=Psychromonas sp. KJ10-10 TaxID=3391823 RepID=UPI0039B4B684